MVPALKAARHAIAATILGDAADGAVRVGRVELREHQREALRRCRAAMREFGGALLADEPGLGKTFVALALAADYDTAVVAAPAALRSMWREAAASAQRCVQFVSLEALSRRGVPARGGLVIVDEAHRASNPAAARYQRLARLTAGAHVLLLSATPIRNRRGELHTMLALFLGAGADTLDSASLARCIVRRRATTVRMPHVVGPVWHRPPRTPNFAADIAGLPSPLPALDGREARALLTTSLARCWASSLAAFDAALTRRLQRGAALQAALDAGRHPTRAELRAWALGDDAVQLAFPALLPCVDFAAARAVAVLEAHLAAVCALRERVRPLAATDAVARAHILKTLRRAHPQARIVAFTAHAATAAAIYAALRRECGIALLSARGARSAGGPRPRGDVLAALGPAAGPRRPAAADDISLVVATDVLSEGVNLQGASVVVHLDLPWTPAALEQRVGRTVRIGSVHSNVYVHGVAPPRAAERLIGLNRLLERKRAQHTGVTGAAADVERLRALVRCWRLPATAPRAERAETSCAPPPIACVRARCPGLLAVVTVGDVRRVVAGMPRSVGWRFSEDPAQILALVSGATNSRSQPAPSEVTRLRALLRQWLRARAARDSSSARPATSRARRLFLASADSLLARSPPHVRATLAPRLVALRSRLAGAPGAGAELLLLELSQLEERSLETWLVACEDRVGQVLTRTPADSTHVESGSTGPRDPPGEILALLLLDSGATPPPPVRASRAQPAASR